MNAAPAVGDGQDVGSGQRLKAVNPGTAEQVFLSLSGHCSHHWAPGSDGTDAISLPSPLWPPGKGLGELEAPALGDMTGQGLCKVALGPGELQSMGLQGVGHD